MKIIVTVIGLMFIQDAYKDKLVDNSKEMSYVKIDKVMAVNMSKYKEGGVIDFYLENSLTDSLGWKPFSVRCYTDDEYEHAFRIVEKALIENKK